MRYVICKITSGVWTHLMLYDATVFFPIMSHFVYFAIISQYYRYIKDILIFFQEVNLLKERRISKEIFSFCKKNMKYLQNKGLTKFTGS